MALGTVGLVSVAASSASATTIQETFGSGGPTGPLELQVAETINQPATVVQGTNMTISVPSATQAVPTTQSGVTVNYIGGLTTIIPVPANSTFVSASIVAGNWSYTPPATGMPDCSGNVPGSLLPQPSAPANLPGCNGTTATGAMAVTECTGPGTGCTATANGTPIPGSNPVVNFAGTTTTPYIEASSGSAQFWAGGSLTLGAYSFDVTASGNGTIVSTVSEFDTVANVVVFGNAINAAVFAYPAALQAGCIVATNPPSCNTPVYQNQPIASTTILSPPAAPVLQPQTGNASAGQCTTINPLTGSTDTGSGDSANPATVVVLTQPANGSASANAVTGIITYCNTGGTAATDTFTVTAADTLDNLGSPPAKPYNLVSAPVTETINISYNQCSAGSGNAGGGSTGTIALPSGTSSGGTNGAGCSLHQAIILPVTAGQIMLTQANGLPSDFLGSQVCAFNPVPGITLNGNEQAACGVVSPLTVTNATGLDTGWTLTGQVSDFNDPAAPTLTCDTVGTYSNHCIPGGNLSWEPTAAVAQSIVPGDTALVTPGAIVPPFSPVGPAVPSDPLLAGVLQHPVQPNPVVEPAPLAGLHDAAQTMCSTASGQAGGTFVCGAGLELLVPASVAEPAQGSVPLQVGQPAPPEYQATLTVTLF